MLDRDALRKFNLNIDVLDRLMTTLVDIAFVANTKGIASLSDYEHNFKQGDIVGEYLDLGITLITSASDPAVSEILLGAKYDWFLKSMQLSEDEILQLSIIKDIIPCIQRQEFEYIDTIQSFLCSYDVSMMNEEKLKK